ncbi:MAG: multiubiquitin domain-containing protein [Planctomycetes bacterium]|nr:multiubiquitin domain-containing protein [Planctomycetota bacterium]
MSNPHPQPSHEVEISVNGKPVRVEGPKSTGLLIKKAAIAQGVSIKLDFVLSQEIGDRKTKVVGDTDEVTVHPHARFIAVAPDDNS